MIRAGLSDPLGINAPGQPLTEINTVKRARKKIAKE